MLVKALSAQNDRNPAMVLDLGCIELYMHPASPDRC